MVEVQRDERSVMLCSCGCVAPPTRVMDLWVAALADSGIEPESTSLHVLRTPLSNQSLACLLPRFRPVDPPVDAGCARVLTNNVNWRLDRVLIHLDGLPDEVVAALLRHELQHSIQMRAHDHLHDLADLAAQVVTFASGIESSRQYNLIPTEQDANAAAYAFACKRFGTAEIAAAGRLHPNQPALRPGHSEHALEVLPGLVIEFLGERRELCHQYVAAGSFANDPGASSSALSLPPRRASPGTRAGAGFSVL